MPDDASFWCDAERHLLRYGVRFTPEIIDRAAGRARPVAADSGAFLRAGLDRLHATHPHVGDVRGRGLFQGIELVVDRETKRGSDELGRRVTQRCLELGLHLDIVQLPGTGSVFRIAPPLTATRDELAEGVEILDRALAESG